jgi:tRNA A-37 threonylcarbamoyl transferase component Bud32
MARALNDSGRSLAAFERAARPPLEWLVRRGAIDGALSTILDDPDGVVDRASSPLKRGRSATVVRVAPYVLKRFQQKRPWNRVFDRIREDRGRRSLGLAAALEAAGVATPRVVATARRIRFGLVACAYLVTEELATATTLLALIDTGGIGDGVLEEVGAAISRIHAAGLSHRDLKASNLMIDAAGRVFFVDLDGVRRRRVTKTRRDADLSRLFRDFDRRPELASTWRAAVIEGYRGGSRGIAGTSGA